jgi:Putative regulator of cell autolysis
MSNHPFLNRTTMGTWVLSGLLCVCCTPLLAQSTYLDSCLTALQRHTQEDTVQLNLLTEIAFEYNYSEPGNGLHYADRAIALAKKLQQEQKLASAYSYKGVNYAAMGNDSAALHLYTMALAIHTKLQNHSGIASTLNNMAIVQVNRGRYAEALDYHTRAFAVLEQLGDIKRMAGALNNIGVVYLYLADYRRALDYYLRALAIQEQLGQNQAMANNLTNIGIIYKNIGDYSNAINYHQRALALYEKENFRQGMANALGNIGVTYDKAKEPVKALEYSEKALALNRQIGNQKHIAGDLTNLGILYKGMTQYSTSRHYLQQALELYTDTDDKNNMTSVLNHLAALYIDAPDSTLARWGMNNSLRYEQAQRYLQQALPLAQATGAVDRLSEVWKSFSDVYAARGNFRNALQAHRQHVFFRDSFYNVETEKQLTRRVMQFEFEKKEGASIAAIEQQRLINRLLLAGAILVLLAAAAIFVFYKRKRDAEARQREAELRAEAADIEMKVLRLQMNPHFIFNSLNSISDYMMKNDIRQADQFLARFAKLMRLILEHSEQSLAPLAGELQALELYLQLEAMRHQGRFTWEIVTNSVIDKNNMLVPPMLLQPLVENSIVHGMVSKNGDGHITVRIDADDDLLYCMVEDNGRGFADSNTASSGKRSSMGLAITRRRIEMINKMANHRASMEIIPAAPGVKVLLTLPLELRF